MNYILQVKDLKGGYDGKQVLHGLSISIERGSMVGILGPNGSGKTTLLKHISAVLKPQAGTVLLEGKDIFSIRRRMLAQKLAFVPQNTASSFEFSAIEVVMMGRMPYVKRFQAERPEDIAAVQQAMEMTGTWGLRERKITELSGGEIQRVMIARALAQQPEILMLDEPTAHLDLQFQMEILELVRRLVDHNGLTVVAVLHDINLAAQFCDKVAFVLSGRIAAYGCPEEVITERLVHDIYSVDVRIWRDDASGAVCVVPVRKAASSLDRDVIRASTG